jgi:hypothetical protein
MYRTQATTPILPLVILVLALAAAALLVGNVILPGFLSERSSQPRDGSLAPALNQEHRSEIDRWRTLDANSQQEAAIEASADRWEAWAKYYQVVKVREAYQVERALRASAARLQGLAEYYLEEAAP